MSPGYVRPKLRGFPDPSSLSTILKARPSLYSNQKWRMRCGGHRMCILSATESLIFNFQWLWENIKEGENKPRIVISLVRVQGLKLLSTEREIWRVLRRTSREVNFTVLCINGFLFLVRPLKLCVVGQICHECLLERLIFSYKFVFHSDPFQVTVSRKTMVEVFLFPWLCG